MTVKAVKKRGGTMIIEAHGEVTMLPTGSVTNFKRSLSRRLQTYAAREAPTNKRPRWGHYGDALKTTMVRSSTRFVKTRNGARLYGVVGSTSPHAKFVEEGTGVYAGGSPWKAKILPPWTQGGGSLYESTWHPPGQQATHNVMIQGQRPQRFMDKAATKAMLSMRIKVGGLAPGAKLGKAIAATPHSIADVVSVDSSEGSAFRTQLDLWRQWRDDQYNAGRMLGQNGGLGSREWSRRQLRQRSAVLRRRTQTLANRRAADARRAKAYRERQREKNKMAETKAKSRDKKPNPRTPEGQRDALRRRLSLSSERDQNVFLMRNRSMEIVKAGPEGFYVRRRGSQGPGTLKPWSGATVNLLDELG